VLCRHAGGQAAPRFTARFESAANDLKRLGGLPSPSEAAGIWDDIWHLEAHNSTALEGNTLILREVQVLLDTGRAVGAKELKDYLEVTGYADAAKWVYTQAHTAHDWDSSGLITVTEIRHIHTVAMSAVCDVAPHLRQTRRKDRAASGGTTSTFSAAA
jgi:Fic family protein